MGAPQIIPVGPTPLVNIEHVSGDLSISGWDRPEIQIKARHDDRARINRTDEGVALRCDGDCSLQVPLQARLKIGSIDGDAVVNMVLGPLEIGSVNGDLSAASVSTLAVGRVGGDLSARSVAGPVIVEAVAGDVRISRVAADVELGSVAGDLVLTESVGNVKATVSGDARLQLAPAPGQKVVVAAAGDVACQVPMDLGATVQLTANGDLRVKNLGESRRATNTTLSFVVGDGSGVLQLSAKGDITLRGAEMSIDEADFGFEAEIGEEMGRRAAELSQQLSQQIEIQVAALTHELDSKLSRIGNNEELAAKIQERVQAAMRRAEEKLAEAMRKVEQRVQEAERRSADAEGRRRKGFTWSVPPPPPPPAPAKPKRPQATDEERMHVLRMVEQGKITVEQAEKLLAAMNG